MRIVKVETLQTSTYPNALWLQLHTDEGLIGLGETFHGADAAAGYIHQLAAPYLLGKDPREVARHVYALGQGMAFRAIGAEARGLSAIDVALWDLFGQSVSLPIYRCLGGPVRDSIRIYNTCAGYGYNVYKAHRPGGSFAESWGIGEHEGPYEDLLKWQERGQAAQLARELLDMGITRMEIAVELHSRWNLQCAIRIAEALEEIGPMWYEDPIKMDNPDALAQFAHSTRVPTTASETMTNRAAFRQMLDHDAIGVVMFDTGWVGGISEGHAIGRMAE